MFTIGKVYNIGNDQISLFNESEIGKSEHKRRRNMKTKSESENREDEGMMSKLDYELSSYDDLLVKAMNPVRGQVFHQNSSLRSDFVLYCPSRHLNHFFKF